MKNKQIKATKDELYKITDYLNSNLPDNIIIFLVGNLASGKTTLASAIGKSKGIEHGVTSPTFSLQQCYGEKLYHYDLYRIDNESFFNLGLHEELEKEGWHLIEWADKYLQSFIKSAGYDTLLINIEYSNDSREYIIIT